MDSEHIEVNAGDLKQLIKEVQLLKNIVLSEGELTDWAKKELDEARQISDSENISIDDLEKEINLE